METTTSGKIEAQTENLSLINALIRKYSKNPNYLPVENTSIDIETTERIYKLTRLKDEQFYMLRKNSISISQDYFHLMGLEMNANCIYSNLAKMYTALRSWFGESGDHYDDWKGAFSFPFLISFKTDDQIIAYLMNIVNIRSSIEFMIAKVLHKDDRSFDRHLLHDPLEEFPRTEMNYLINFIVGFLTGVLEAAKDRHVKPFVKTVKSNQILFGYKGGEYFEHHYQSSEEFEEAIEDRLKNNIPNDSY